MQKMTEAAAKSKCARCGTVDGDLSVRGTDGRMVKIECYDDSHQHRPGVVITGGAMAHKIYSPGGLRDSIHASRLMEVRCD